MSLRELDQSFKRIAADPQGKGVILNLRSSPASGFADLQNFRESILSLRRSGKRVIAYSSIGYSLNTYYIASAADEILLQPFSEIHVGGFTAHSVFLKDALARVGLACDVTASHPYKTGGDMLSQNSPSKEFNEENNRLLDGWFDNIVEDIAEGRNMDVDAVRSMVDGGVYLDSEALKLGYIDGVLNEEQLPRYFGVENILAWDQAKMQYKDSWWQATSLQWKYVAVVRIEGFIGVGENRPMPFTSPILGSNKFTGDLTVVQQVRQLMRDKYAAALILYVDSPGGDTRATETIAAALREFNKERPVIVYMNNYAASGGYFVSTAGRWIVARPGTTTGSIGAISIRVIDEELYSKLSVNRITFTRGENANMQYGVGPPYTDAQKKRRRELLDYYYNRFASVVGKSRNMTQEKLDAVCQGRIWTGKQALDCGLVDELGGLEAAFKKARELADLPDNTPLVFHSFKDGNLIPPELVNPAAALNHVNEFVTSAGGGRTLLLMPHSVISM